MSKQMIISIGREYGSGGHIIAEKIAEKYGIALYDRNILDKIEQERGINTSEFQAHEEKRRNPFFTRSVSGYSNSLRDIAAEMEFDFLREKADAGESFVIVGRCANSVLSDFDGLVSIFVTSDMEFKLNRARGLFPDMSDRELERMIASNNRKRKAFHNYYSKEKWGDSRYYELTISTAKIGVESASKIIDEYIQARFSE